MIHFSSRKIRDDKLLGRCRCGSFRGGTTRRGDQVAVPHYYFMNSPLRSIALRRELALLDGAFDENVVSLLEGHRDAGKVTVERQAVPVGVLLRLAIPGLVSVAFTETDVGDGCS
jgi:hypothetical protein